MKDFAAIDFETANSERSSVCSVGVVIVRGGEIVDKFYSLIKPEPAYYNYWCSRVHGLCAADTQNAPVFPEVWRQIEPKIAGLPLVLSWPTTNPSTKAALRPSFVFTKWTILTMSSTALASLRVRFGQEAAIISTSLPPVVDMT